MPVLGLLSKHSSLDYRTRPIQSDEFDRLCRINHDLFSGSSLGTSLHDIEERNHSILEKNSLSFSLVEAKTHDGYFAVGMSSMLPLNQLGESVYCRTGRSQGYRTPRSTHSRAGRTVGRASIFIVGSLNEFRGCLRAYP